MLTYNLSKSKGPIYLSLYRFIKNDIEKGILEANQKLPSKRALAQNLGISSISVENAYAQLISEGYILSIPKKGYFVCDIFDFSPVQTKSANKKINIRITEQKNRK